MYKSNPHRGWVFDLILSTVTTVLSKGGRNCRFQMAHFFLSRLQVALLSAACSDIILKLRQVICLEVLYLRIDLVAVPPTGYGFTISELSSTPSASATIFNLKAKLEEAR